MMNNSESVENIRYMHEQEMWEKFYLSFNDDNYEHCVNAFISNGLNGESVTSFDLRKENIDWVREIRTHGTSDAEILSIMPEAAEYLNEA